MATVRIPSGEQFSAEPGENLLSAAQRAHWLVRHGCRNGNCGVCTATLLKGEVIVGDSHIASRDAPEILLCRSRIEADIEIRLPGNPLHGSPEQAQRRFAQLQSVTASDDHFRLRLQLPAGRRAPIYPGQYLLIEEDDDQLLRAEIDLAQSSGRSLSLLAARPPRVDGERVHIRYPLGHAFVAAPPQRPVWIVHGVARALQAQLLRQHLPRALLLQVGGGDWQPPPLSGAPLLLACAANETQARQWFEALLATGLTPAEFRSDFGVWHCWRVMRQDDNGNCFEVTRGATEAQARAQVTLLSASAHKQLYWAEPLV